jgi:hypothetical protein
VHVGLGNHDAALAVLEHGYELRDPAMSGLGVDARFGPLAADRRFAALLEKIGVR